MFPLEATVVIERGVDVGVFPLEATVVIERGVDVDVALPRMLVVVSMTSVVVDASAGVELSTTESKVTSG